AELLRGGDVVILWGERLAHGPRGAQALTRLIRLAADTGAKLIEIPENANARGLREVGCSPALGPGLADAPAPGRDGASILAGLADGELTALVTTHARTEGPKWEQALDAAAHVVAFSDFLSPALAEHANVVFPSESYAEREGTVTHTDGRIQRVRQAVGRPGAVRAAWSVIEDLLAALSSPTGAQTAAMVWQEITEAVGPYAGVTLEAMGGHGVRWAETGSAPPGELPEAPSDEAPAAGGTGLRLGSVRSLWAGPETEHSPALRFLKPEGVAELSPEDAKKRGVGAGETVTVHSNGTSVRARAALRSAVPAGSVFLVDGGTGLPDGESVEVTRG
ncbi:MAG: molybdopterin-dependent oxidoreductase, partial [Thermoleophilaceae bacterium]|nr:molybdopterin-dependent oxidoreductase [Thermoleophilaceae bacterium]